MGRHVPALIALLACLLAGAGASWAFGSLVTRPTSVNVSSPPFPARNVSLISGDGARIAGTYWPGGAEDGPAVLLLHGLDASRAMFVDNASWLAGQGYGVLTIDLRGHGESALAERSFGLHESRDAAAGLRWLKRRRCNAPIAVVGVSLGGAAALLGTDGPLPADALGLQAVYPDIRRAIRNRIAARAAAAPAHFLEPLLSFQSLPRFGAWPGQFSPLSAVRRYRGPLFVIGGADDRSTPPAETRAIFAAAPGRKRLWIVPGADHAEASGLRGRTYRERLARFLRETIGAPRPT